MKYLVIFLSVIALFSGCSTPTPPLKLHPDNPHYFLFRGKPTVLIGSTEHYGAVLNLDFDYIKYLDEVAASGLNITRTFSGIYLEPQGAFNISHNSMAPDTGRSICPWTRSNEPGYALGGNKFDLDQWDEAYFNRLKDFISEAGKRNIIVELDLFSNFYDTIQWKLSPVNYRNNINRLPVIDDQKEVLSLRHSELLAIQEKMVRKIIMELNGFDNLYYEVCNEPYFGDLQALHEWEKHMTAVVVDAEKDLPNKHLISNNIGNGTVKVEKPNDGVSILNFHYAKPPESVGLNYHFNIAIGDNETGFRGIEDVHYRTEAWEFMTAGGALYNNLDYSFTVGHEDGTFEVVQGQPGGGGKNLRNQLKIMAGVFSELDFINMKPDSSVLQSISDSGSIRILAGKSEYLAYIQNPATKLQPGKTEFVLNLPNGNYNGQWIDTKTGQRKDVRIPVNTDEVNFTTPEFKEDIALVLKRI
ncbi:MAG TPA: hypothetical protein VK179_16225 [Bacteroidales bacterium]|nr:hypothetical protein [Bacteroidales bacterium]